MLRLFPAKATAVAVLRVGILLGLLELLLLHLRLLGVLLESLLLQLKHLLLSVLLLSEVLDMGRGELELLRERLLLHGRERLRLLLLLLLLLHSLLHRLLKRSAGGRGRGLRRRKDTDRTAG